MTGNFVMDKFINLTNSDTGRTIHIKAKDIIAMQHVDAFGEYTYVYVKNLPRVFTVKERCGEIFELMEITMEE